MLYIYIFYTYFLLFLIFQKYVYYSLIFFICFTFQSQWHIINLTNAQAIKIPQDTHVDRFMLQTQFRFAIHKMYHSLDAAKPSLGAIEIGGMLNVTRCISREIHAPRYLRRTRCIPVSNR